MRRPERPFSPEFRATTAIAALKGDKTMAELDEMFAHSDLFSIINKSLKSEPGQKLGN